MTFSNKSIALEDEKQEESTDNKIEEPAEAEDPKTEKVEKDEGEGEEKPAVSSSVGDGFFDDFANSNLNEEASRGRGER